MAVMKPMNCSCHHTQMYLVVVILLCLPSSSVFAAVTNATKERPTAPTTGDSATSNGTRAGATRPNATTERPTAPTAGDSATSNGTRVGATRPNEATTITVRPTPPSFGNRAIRDANGNICMKMSFSAQMNITYKKTNQEESKVVVNLSSATADLVSDCNNPSSIRALTIYPFTRLEKEWNFWLTFKKQFKAYTLVEVGASWKYDVRFVDSADAGVTSSEHRGKDNFLAQEVPLGNAYSCDEPLTVGIEPATIRLSNILLQPFAEEAGGRFGQAEQCHKGLPQPTIIATAGSVGAVISSAGLLAIIVACCRRKKENTCCCSECNVCTNCNVHVNVRGRMSTHATKMINMGYNRQVNRPKPVREAH